MHKHALSAMGLMTLLACSPGAEQSATAPAHEQAGSEAALAHHAATILGWAQAQHGNDVYQPLQIIYGDFSGDGVDDALAWILYPTGGNSDFLHVVLFRNENGQMMYHHSADEVFGSNPREVVFTRGRITLTTTMPNPGDPRCCPTGSQNWEIMDIL